MRKTEPSFSSLSPLIDACASLPYLKSLPPLSKDTRRILALLYHNIKGPYAKEIQTYGDQLESKLKAPVLVSFHPKLSLLNNNIHETLIAIKLAEKSGQIPLWIPYVYDTATHSAAEGGKIRAPTYAFIEDEFLALRSAAQIHGNIVKTEKPISKSEMNQFFLNLEKLLLEKLGNLQRQLNQYNFGHELFDLKLKVMSFNRKKLKKLIENEKSAFQAASKGSRNLGESLGQISLHLMHELGLPMNLAFIETVLPEIVIEVFQQIINQDLVKNDPSVLEGLFVHYNVKEKMRTPILFTGDKFLAIDDSAIRQFDGTLDDLAEGIRLNQILPTGPSLILLFTALGCSVSLGGIHTQEYYPDYLKNATKLLKDTNFNSVSKVLGYGNIRMLDTRSMQDIMAVSRILEKVGSRTIVKKGNITFPDDVVDHLNFLIGSKKVPIEYEDIIKVLMKDAKESSSALEKESKRFELISTWNKLDSEGLYAHIPEMKPYFRKLNLEELHSERLKIAVETLAMDTEMRMERLKENISLEQHLLGGKISKIHNPDLDCDNDDPNVDNSGGSDGNFGSYMFDNDDDEIPFEEIFSGLLVRSKRVPTLLEMVLYGAKTDLDFLEPVSLVPSESPYYLGLIIPQIKTRSAKGYQSYTFKTFRDAFKTLIPEKKMPQFFFTSK